MAWFDDKGDHLVVHIRTIPRASKDCIQGVLGDALKVRIQAPPVEGKANAYLIKFLAQQWGLPRNSITLISGETGRDKRLRITSSSTKLRKQLLSIKA